MIMRLAFAIITVIPADIYIVDEFFSVGDADFRLKCGEYFLKLQRQHKTIIASSHDLGWLITFCSQIYPIDHGRIDPTTGIKPGYIDFYRRSIQHQASVVTVLTHSMSPTIKSGQQVRIQPQKFKQVTCGDIIAFMFPNYPQPIIHRVVARGIRQQQTILITQGDANDQIDPWIVTEMEYIGIVIEST
jgi:energy-coupling factor transporter ATP-binding protein EcfA2